MQLTSPHEQIQARIDDIERSPTGRLNRLIDTFPAIKGMRAWNAEQDAFSPEEWLKLRDTRNLSTTQNLLITFIASVWAGGTIVKYPFDMFAFCMRADRGNRDAMVNWMKDPVFP